MANQVLYGFITLADLFAKRVTEVGVNVVATAIDRTVAEHNRQLDSLMSLFVKRTTDFKVRYRTPSVARLQPLDESGRARPIRPAGQYDVAYPLQMAGAAWGNTYLAGQKMTVAEANEATATLLSADIRWVRDHILSALYANAAWTFTDPEHGALSIQGLANGDTTQYLVLGGADVGATDSHYLAQAAAIADVSNPFPAIYNELKEHPENGGEVVALIPSNLRASVEALTNFLPKSNPNVQAGGSVDTLVGSLGVATPGDVFGYVDGVWVVEWRSLPNDYIIAVTTDGDRAVAMREEVIDSLRGFRQVARRDDHPFYESQWLRLAGFGGFNRVGAVVYRIGNAAYAIPTGYAAPVP